MIIPFSQKYNYKAGKQKKVTQIYDNTKKTLHEAMKRKKKKSNYASSQDQRLNVPSVRTETQEN